MKIRRPRMDIENKILIPFVCISLATVICFCAILYFTEYRVKVAAERENASTLIGYIQADLELEDYRQDPKKLLAKYRNHYTGDSLFIYDEQGELLLGKPGVDAEDLEVLAQATDPQLGWEISYRLDNSALQERFIEEQKYMILAAVAMLVIIVQASVLIAHNISDPIRRLEQSIKELEAGRDNVEIEERGCYEVQHLSRSIRSMVSTMHHLMDDIVQQEAQKRRSELEVLQSQINPHFLYNTLDSVIWMTEAGRYDEAIQMVTSLARLFRISLSRGSSIITLADELEHARHYMNIQQIRYKNRFTTEITAEPGTEGLYTLKLIVQPILENAIYHGMSAAEDEGVISVRAYRRGDDLFIDVEDNGLGMRPEVAEQLLEEHRPAINTKGSGIGVRNVHQRIQLTFGRQYGLTIQSEPDEGTLVRIHLPALDEEASRPYRKEAGS